MTHKRYAVRFETDEPDLLPGLIADGAFVVPKIEKGDVVTAPDADGRQVELLVVEVHPDGSFDAEPTS
jgi:hypothetical protein